MPYIINKCIKICIALGLNMLFHKYIFRDQFIFYRVYQMIHLMKHPKKLKDELDGLNMYGRQSLSKSNRLRNLICFFFYTRDEIIFVSAYMHHFKFKLLLFFLYLEIIFTLCT